MKLAHYIILILLSFSVFACSGNAEKENQGEEASRKVEFAASGDISTEEVSPIGENIEKDTAMSSKEGQTDDSQGSKDLHGQKDPPESKETRRSKELFEEPIAEDSEGILEVFYNNEHGEKVDPKVNTPLKGLKNITKIIYRFRDSSVPPPYHRSFRVTVTPEGSNHIVTDYSDELSNTTTELEEGAWDELVKLAQKIQKPGSYEARGATGTTGNTIQIFNGDEEIYSLYWDSLSKNKIKKSTFAFKDAINATASSGSPLD